MATNSVQIILLILGGEGSFYGFEYCNQIRGIFMDEYDHTLISLVIVGVFIALGKMLVANETITLRLFIGRIILGSAVSVVAGALLILWPGINPIAVLGIGSALGIAGYQLVEIWLRKRGNQLFSGKGKDDTK